MNLSGATLATAVIAALATTAAAPGSPGPATARPAAVGGSAVGGSAVARSAESFGPAVLSRISVSGREAQANDQSSGPAISGNGRYVAFASGASNLVPGDTNGQFDVFLRDLKTGTTSRVSVSSAEVQGNNASHSAAVSHDGRYVAFVSYATNLVRGDTNENVDVFVRDLRAGTTTRVSLAPGGKQANSHCFEPSISRDGRYVAFESTASNLVARDTNRRSDAFVRDRRTGVTSRVSVSGAGAQAGNHTYRPSISSDGRYVSFDSFATNLVPRDSSVFDEFDVFLRDRRRGTTRKVSVSRRGVSGDNASMMSAISGNGRYVAFESEATNLVAGDRNNTLDVFVKDLHTGAVSLVSSNRSGAQGDGISYDASISADGRYVAFQSQATNLVSRPVAGTQVYVRDRRTGNTRLVSVSGRGVGDSYSFQSALSADGRRTAFSSDATNLVGADTNQRTDIFLSRRNN